MFFRIQLSGTEDNVSQATLQLRCHLRWSLLPGTISSLVPDQVLVGPARQHGWGTWTTQNITTVLLSYFSIRSFTLAQHRVTNIWQGQLLKSA